MSNKRRIIEVTAIVLTVSALFLLVRTANGQTSPRATYKCTVKAGSDGDGTVSVIYSIFAGDQQLTATAREILLPVYNSSAILDSTIAVKDSFDNNLASSWQNDRTSLKVTTIALNIPAGGKYEVTATYDQNSLSSIINGTHYFVYEWDFSIIFQAPYTITQYDLTFERPADTLFDSYSVDYIGISPSVLTNYITQSGTSVTLSYNFSMLKVTMNVYYKHQFGPTEFTIITIFFVIAMAAALTITIRRRRW